MSRTNDAAHAAAADAALPIERIFLTGGSGYIGRNLIRHFLGKGLFRTACHHENMHEWAETATGNCHGSVACT